MCVFDSDFTTDGSVDARFSFWRLRNFQDFQLLLKRQHGREVTVEGRGGGGARVPPPEAAAAAAATRAPAAPQSKRLLYKLREHENIAAYEFKQRMRAIGDRTLVDE